jgi:proteic killer suppression protein
MIRSFRDAETERVFQQHFSKAFQSVARVALRKLMHVNQTTGLEDLKALPGNRLEPLKGERQGQYSIRINDQYRVCFRWEDGDAVDVEIVDYH